MSKLRFTPHPELEGRHALFSPSQHSWLNYNVDATVKKFLKSYSQEIGTLIHELASRRIISRYKIDYIDKNLIINLLSVDNHIPYDAYNTDKILHSLVPFVNDCIDDNMDSEVALMNDYTSFGHTDAIKYEIEAMELYISDYKSGENQVVEFDQLIIYAAYFFLEYGQRLHIDPYKVKKIRLRLYQTNSEDPSRSPISELLYIKGSPDEQNAATLPELIKETMDNVKQKTDVIKQVKIRNGIL
jgi:hypothetical protein